MQEHNTSDRVWGFVWGFFFSILALIGIAIFAEGDTRRRMLRGAFVGWIVGWIVGLGLIAGLIASTSGGGDASVPSSVDSGEYGSVELPAALNTTGELPSGHVGRAAPDFLLKTLDGDDLRLSDLRGRAVLVNFWASWCTPCNQAIPLIVSAYDANADRSFTVVVVDLQENADAVRDFADESKMDFPVVIDQTGEVGESWRIQGPIEGIPASYFIDAKGIVQARVFGSMSAESLAANLKSIGVGQ